MLGNLITLADSLSTNLGVGLSFALNSSTVWLLSNTDMNGRVYGALVQFGCYQHRWVNVKAPSLLSCSCSISPLLIINYSHPIRKQGYALMLHLPPWQFISLELAQNFSFTYFESWCMVRKNIDVKRPQMAAETSASGRNECETIYSA